MAEDVIPYPHRHKGRKGGLLGVRTTPHAASTMQLDADRRNAAKSPEHPRSRDTIDQFLTHFSPACLVFRENLWPADKALADVLAQLGRLVYSPQMGAYSLPTLAGAEQRGHMTPSEARHGVELTRVDAQVKAARNNALAAIQSATTHIARAHGVLERGETLTGEDMEIIAGRLMSLLHALERHRASAELRSLLDRLEGRG